MTEHGRTPFLAGNWKMNLDRKSGLELASELRDRVGDRVSVEVMEASEEARRIGLKLLDAEDS